MKIKELIDEKVVVILNNGIRLEGTIKAIDNAGIGFETSKKSSYISFSDIFEIKTVPLLEKVTF